MNVTRLPQRMRSLLDRYRIEARRLLRSFRLNYGDFEVVIRDEDRLDLS